MAIPDEPLTRGEQYLAKTAGQDVTLPDEPLTRMEQYLAKIAGQDVTLPDVPQSRVEQYLDYIAENGGGGGGDITLETLNVSSNGTTNAPSGKAYNKVVTSVPNSYSAGDEGKVVSNGSLVSQTAHATVAENGTIDTTLNNSVEVAVPLPSGSISISTNDTYDVTQYASAVVSVPQGAQVYTGTVELNNTSTSELSIPVDVSAASHFEVIAYVDKTGLVSGGTVTYDDEPLCHSEVGTLVWYYLATERMSDRHILRDASNYSNQSRANNVSYLQLYNGNNGSGVQAECDVKDGTKITLKTMNGTRKFCNTGCYVRFAYTVVVA